jgi:peroxiredoxin
MKSTIFTFVFLLLTSFVFAQSVKKVGKLEVGKPMANFTLVDLKDKPWELTDLKGKTAVFYFWIPDTASVWNEQMAAVGEIADMYRKQGVVCLAPGWSMKDQLADFLKGRRFAFNTLADGEGWAYNNLDMDSFPVIVIVKNYMIEKIYSGYDPDMAKLVKDDLQALIEQK